MTDDKSLEWLLDEPLDDEELAWDHAMEISGSVYRRMQELGMKKKDLANRMGVSPSRISHILGGEQSMTLATLARLENALDFDMSHGFSSPKTRVKSSRSCLVIPFPGPRAKENDHQSHSWVMRVREG